MRQTERATPLAYEEITHGASMRNFTDKVLVHTRGALNSEELKDKKWPLLIFLCGYGGYRNRKGTPADNWPPSHAPDIPMVVLAPQVIRNNRDGLNGWRDCADVIDGTIIELRRTLVNSTGMGEVRELLGQTNEGTPGWTNQPVYLCGTSYGGGGAWFLAAHPPSKVGSWAKVALVCPKFSRRMKSSLFAHAARIGGCPVRIYQNVFDGIAKVEEYTLELLDALRGAKNLCEADFLVHAKVPENGHSRGQQELDDWIAKLPPSEHPRFRRRQYRTTVHHHDAWTAAYAHATKLQQLFRVGQAPRELYDWFLADVVS